MFDWGVGRSSEVLTSVAWKEEGAQGLVKLVEVVRWGGDRGVFRRKEVLVIDPIREGERIHGRKQLASLKCFQVV